MLHIRLGGEWKTFDEVLATARIKGSDGQFRPMTRDELILTLLRR